MDSKEKSLGVIKCMECLLERLAKLLNVADTMSLGLKSELAEAQMLDCMDYMCKSIRELFDFTKESLTKIYEEE